MVQCKLMGVLLEGGLNQLFWKFDGLTSQKCATCLFIHKKSNFEEIGLVLPPCTYALKFIRFDDESCVRGLPYFIKNCLNLLEKYLDGFLIKLAFK